MSSQPRHRFTPDEYLALERTADVKSEYLDGEIFAMAGASPRHALIVTNVAAELRAQLRRRPCAVFSTELRVRVAPDGLYTYPDVVVVCGPLQLHDETRDTLTNPSVIVEVLSRSTQNSDRGEKFEQYRKLASLAEYVLIAQDRPHVELFARQADGSWVLSETNDPQQAIDLAAIGCRLELAEIYAKVDDIKE
jgi:Uma2 family endonuclease